MDGAVAFISGVARGQGRSHAVRLARSGARIIGFDLCAQIDTVPFDMATPDDMAETERLVREAGGEIVTSQADVRDQQQVDAALAVGLEAFGRVDIVLGNAGIIHNYRKTWELDDDDFRNVIDVNITGVWHTVKTAVPRMIEQGDGGAIVLTGSGASVGGIPNLAGYVASKHAVLGMMRTMAKELGRYQIRVNAVMPGNRRHRYPLRHGARGTVAYLPRAPATRSGRWRAALRGARHPCARAGLPRRAPSRRRPRRSAAWTRHS
jgi:NAD(P)-dependent dehydrogenase (short-subunit alcohol dehydrogenase family)